jgi:hypothetical protein
MKTINLVLFLLLSLPMVALARNVVYEPEEEASDLTDIQSPGFPSIRSEVLNSTGRAENEESVSFQINIYYYVFLKIFTSKNRFE